MVDLGAETCQDRRDAEEPLAAVEGDDAPLVRTPSLNAVLLLPRRVSTVVFGVVAAIALTAVLFSRAAASDRLHGSPQVHLEEDQPSLEGLEELHSGLVDRLANPDHEEDMAELRRIGMDHPAYLKMMSRGTQVKPSLEDVREILSYRRRILHHGGVVDHEEEEQQEQAAQGGPHIENGTGWTGNRITNAKCGFHVGQTVLYLVEACLAIQDAAQDCPQIQESGTAIQGRRKGRKARQVCAIDIMTIFSSFSWTAYFITALASQCTVLGQPALPGSLCAGEVTSMLAGLLQLAETATAVGTDCSWLNVKQAALEAKLYLKKTKAPQPARSELGFCVIAPMQASYWLFRAALDIKNAARDCKGDGWQDCTTDVLAVITTLGFAAGFLASAASDCAPAMNTHALCASDITSMVASVTMISGSSISFTDGACSPEKLKTTER